MLSPFLEDREVIEPDERWRVPNTLEVPFRWVCSLDVTWVDGMFARGTGLLIGPRHVVTAAHNIYRRQDGASPASLYVAPARQGRTDPFGRTKAVANSIVGEFLDVPKGVVPAVRVAARSDFALLTLERDVSTLTHRGLGGAPLGHWGHPTRGHGTVLRALDEAFLIGKQVRVCGFPGDHCGAEKIGSRRLCGDLVGGCSKEDRATVMLGHDGVLSRPPGLPGLLRHTADTCPGQSGSPVWMRFRDGSRYLVGVHVSSHGAAHNRLVHLSADVLRVLRGWMP